MADGRRLRYRTATLLYPIRMTGALPCRIVDEDNAADGPGGSAGVRPARPA
jgi:hypothetical protein